MKGFISKAKYLLFIFVLSSFFTGQIVSAQGDGTGGNSGQPVTLVSSSIANGAAGVTLKPTIKLVFDKNIVNFTVKDNNLKCFTLHSSTGASVPIDVIFADDQVDFADRDNAIITPKANLDQGTTYTLDVSPNLQSKSGSTLAQEVKITFTTEGTKPASNNNTNVSKTTTPTKASAPNASIATPSTSKTTSAASKPAEPATTAQKTSDSQTKTTNSQVKTADSQLKTADNKTTAVQPAAASSGNNVSSSNATTNEASAKNADNAAAKSENAKSGSIGFVIVFAIIAILIIAGINIYVYKRKGAIK